MQWGYHFLAWSFTTLTFTFRNFLGFGIPRGFIELQLPWFLNHRSAFPQTLVTSDISSLWSRHVDYVPNHHQGDKGSDSKPLTVVNLSQIMAYCTAHPKKNVSGQISAFLHQLLKIEERASRP
uniref:Uncharacterized protein n=1 Tax=Eutreptiella gymnastica TaxID=73025 RepID=A0A7S1IKP8_9EUGL|mmetsp:Transcript_23817/g.42911  ORF Transcript_23817/g.42911 Transcript_23817/m.42911 type:complete len:123 (+) Transcript_23817:2065-2433(+)